MLETEIPSAAIIRTERGLTVAGTRITLYDVMTYLKAEWPPHLIQHWLNLSAEQLAEALSYLRVHCDAVEAEYQQVVEHAAANRRYWDAQNRDRLAQVAHLPPQPGHEAILAKLKAHKAARGEV